MSLELETLDQLCGGDMPLSVIRQIFADGRHFERAILAMLDDGDVRLLRNGTVAAPWEWRRLVQSPPSD